MPSIETNDVTNAILITIGMMVVAITIVAIAMYFVYRFFQNNDESDQSPSSENGAPPSSNEKPKTD